MTTTDTETLTIGRITYAVTRTDSEEVPYELRGPRGAHYGLMRNVPNPTLLFPINMRAFGVDPARLGWFTDKDGTLRWLR